MRLFLPLVATLLLAAMPLPVQSKTAPVKGVVQGTATAGKASLGAPATPAWVSARSAPTVARSTGATRMSAWGQKRQ